MKKATLCLALIIVAASIYAAVGDIVVDSKHTFESATAGTKAPMNIIDKLELFEVEYYGFDGRVHTGKLLMHKELKKDIVEVFALMKEKKFPVQKVIPIVDYNWSDDASMEDNNTSGFNYRFVANTTRLSNHATGRAIDINPFQNPAVYSDGKVSPKGAKYDKKAPGTIRDGDFIVTEFKKRGWRWGGDFTSLKDYQHFDKEIK